MIVTGARIESAEEEQLVVSVGGHRWLAQLTAEARGKHEYLRELVAWATFLGLRIPEEAAQALNRPERDWHFDSYDCDLGTAINFLELELGDEREDPAATEFREEAQRLYDEEVSL